MVNTVCISGSQPCATKAQECASSEFFQLLPSAREEEQISKTCSLVGLKICRLLDHDDTSEMRREDRTLICMLKCLWVGLWTTGTSWWQLHCHQYCFSVLYTVSACHLPLWLTPVLALCTTLLEAFVKPSCTHYFQTTSVLSSFNHMWRLLKAVELHKHIKRYSLYLDNYHLIAF